jgi:hypothetical protein
MAYTYEELKKQTVAHLRELAESVGDQNELHGFRTMHKEELLPHLCHALGIEDHEHHEVIGIDKREIKDEIQVLKEVRDTALAAGDPGEYRAAIKKIRRLKRTLRRAMV